MYRLQLLGFNAVRLPFSFSDLYDKQPESQQRNCAQASLRLSLSLLKTDFFYTSSSQLRADQAPNPPWGDRLI